MVDERGDPWEHDPGPTTKSGWAALFADTPNYRGLGRAVLGREVFRWQHGPMFFRGRLDGSARVVLVGQEGAQDESLSHRSFTGGTGARMQHFLHHLGLNRSYLFLNSFVYPILGQYTDALRPLAQDRRSPIARHRNRILDKAVVDGDARLVVAVGRAAKESVANWVGSHGGSADPDRLDQAVLGSLPGSVRLAGVVHPGSAGGSTGAIRADFQRACDLIRAWVQADASWLPTDPGMPRDLGAAYEYRSAAIPYRDFPFGTCQRLGRGGTSSNRSDEQRGIRLFSANGRYNAAGANLRDPSTATGSRDGYRDDAGDLPYEPPTAAATAFDRGPPEAGLARLLLGGEPGLGWPDFAALGVTSHPSFGVGAICRGRFSKLSLLVLADQASDDDLFTGRALSGDAGQHLNQLLLAAGLTSRYLIVRTLPVDTLDLTQSRRNGLLDRPQVQALHRELLRRVVAQNRDVTALLAVGPGAQRLAPKVAPRGLKVVQLAAHGASGQQASWRAALRQLATRHYPKDLSHPSFRLPAGRGQLPRTDLPYGTLRWVGTSGDRAVRPVDLDLDRPSPDYLKLFAPAWVAELPPAPLTRAERAAADQL